VEPAPGEETAPPAPRPETAHWLLSLYSPAESDAIDWQRGSYSMVTRGGRVESPVRSGEEKKLLRMVEEGSVLAGPSAPRGAAPDVAPEGFPHPVYRSGIALSIPVPLRQSERALGAS
jgi:CRISPR/Cas system CSM-associated protein Csm4 (group 5 of RAMP superfamily)